MRNSRSISLALALALTACFVASDPWKECSNGRLCPADAECSADGERCLSCGNAIPEDGEQCDDGNLIDGDTCDQNCTFPVCGNGIMTTGEACDDGNEFDGDGCDRDCTESCREECGEDALPDREAVPR